MAGCSHFVAGTTCHHHMATRSWEADNTCSCGRPLTFAVKPAVALRRVGDLPASAKMADVLPHCRRRSCKLHVAVCTRRWPSFWRCGESIHSHRDPCKAWLAWVTITKHRGNVLCYSNHWQILAHGGRPHHEQQSCLPTHCTPSKYTQCHSCTNALQHARPVVRAM